jgi:cellulose synthase/poly-beta-1,6-N-acetylglucosamine synthase-like glycosyltransferase
MVLEIVLLSASLFLLINLFILVIFKKNSVLSSNFNDCLNFSIIIAVKNEEENIPSLIKSLRELNYPKENFEVIIVDDNSLDKTYKIGNELIEGFTNFKIIKIGEKDFQAKKGALSYGIHKAYNSFILITDADCRPQKEWLKFYSERFMKGYDFIFGNAPFYKNDSLINNISCFENLRSSILTFFAAKAGIPYSASARNFAFRKSSFDKIKGYSNTTETLSGDDDLLLREAVKNNLKIGAILNDGSFVYSYTKRNLRDYFNQKARHTKTSFYYLTGRQLFLSLWHLLNLFFLLSPVLIIFNIFWGVLFFLKLLVDSIIIKSIQDKFGYRFSLSEILYLQIIYELFLIIHFVNALIKKDKWK